MTYPLANAATELLSFYGALPIQQPTAAAQAAVTDNSGGSANPTTGVAAVAFKETIVLSLGSMASIADSQVYKIALPYAFTIVSLLFRADNPITTTGKAVTLTAQISGTAATGGIISVAGAYATGATQAATAISGAVTGSAGATLEVATSGTTTFVEGTGHVEVTIINNSLANATATMIAQANAIRSALVNLGIIKGS
jgi:hypothetical protein